MRSFTVSICTLVLVSSVFAAPTAQLQDADGKYVEDVVVAHGLEAPTSYETSYGSDTFGNEYPGTNDKRSVFGDNYEFFECLDDNDGGIPQVIVTTTATTVTGINAVAFQPYPTPAPISTSHNSNGGLLGIGGLLGGLLGSGSSDHNPAPPLGAQQLSGLTNNGNPVGNLADHLIDLDLNATVNAGSILQATATATLGLL
ncbi:hypothetical protein Clacol_001730 [Clathrus columnatus]|uniref:Uncharacterized protein n=1 Tax=Clathrus columnatus TaxID=1419009 RepID=A0AAV5A4F4_9AGAM|nr:hypothetical protein Clacol_001730 [Clathrus columnatus]